jgi:ribose transport system substrate-binding protein
MNAIHLALAAAMAASLTTGAVNAARAEGLDAIPADIQERLYSEEMLDPQQPIDASVYHNWKAKKGPPWVIGYASSYAGNTWRSAAMERLQNELLPKWKKLGLVKDLVVTQSELNDAKQSDQIRQLVDQGADAIIVCCSDPIALNETIRYAYEKGVPTFSFTGYLTSKFAINSSVNYQLAGYMIGEWMANEIGRKGNVLVVEGIPGTSASDSQDRGIKESLTNYPDVKIVGDIAGMWTDNVAEAAVQRWLAAHPGKLDAVIVQSAAELGVLHALQQSGHDMVPVTIGGEVGALCYWRTHEKYVSAAFQVWPPGDDVELAWNIMMRTLEGQGPKLQSVLVDPVRLDFDGVKAVLNDDCSQDTAKWFNPDPANWGSDPAYLDNFFEHPADPTKFKP